MKTKEGTLKKPKVIYRAVYDGIFSNVEELTEAETDYHYVEEIDNSTFFRSRGKAISELKKQLRERIANLQATIKNLK